jgi:hypothetical protein
MPILESKEERSAILRSLFARGAYIILGFRTWRPAKQGLVLGAVFGIPGTLCARAVGASWLNQCFAVLIAALAAGLLIALVTDALFPRGKFEQRDISAIGLRLAEGKAHLEWLDAEKLRRGDSGFGKDIGDRIVWCELLDLELYDVDEQVQRICDAAGDVRRVETRAKEVLVNATSHEPLSLNHEERALLAELLEAASTKLLVEIRRTDHRVYRDELRHRLTMVDSLRARCSKTTLPDEGD